MWGKDSNTSFPESQRERLKQRHYECNRQEVWITGGGKLKTAYKLNQCPDDKDFVLARKVFGFSLGDDQEPQLHELRGQRGRILQSCVRIRSLWPLTTLGLRGYMGYKDDKEKQDSRDT